MESKRKMLRHFKWQAKEFFEKIAVLTFFPNSSCILAGL